MKIRVLLTLIIAVLTLAACSENTSESQASNEPESTIEKEVDSEETSEPEKLTPDKTEYDIGETIVLGDLELVITRVEFTGGDLDNQPSEGNFFANVFIHAKNNGENLVKLSSSDFTFYDFNGDVSPQVETGYFVESQLTETELDGNSEIKVNII